MRRLTTLLVVLPVVLAVAPCAAQDSQPRETLAISLTLQVIASDPESSSESVAAWADAVGGYFTYRSDQQVIIRVPPGRVPEVRRHVQEMGDTVVEYNPSAVDHRESLARSTAAIQSRTEALDRILAYLDEADVTATLSFERELRSLLQEIEYFTGQRRRMQNEVAYASATVNLSSRQRTIPEQRPSTFQWINTVDLYRFLREVRP